MKMSEVFPSKYLCATDLGGNPLVLTIEKAMPTMLKDFTGDTERQKIVLHFARAKKTLPLNKTNWKAVVDATREDDSDKWAGHRIEVYPDTTEVSGKVVDCIRIRKPAELPLENTAEAAKQEQKLPRSIAGDLDDEIPFVIAAMAVIPLLALLVGVGTVA